MKLTDANIKSKEELITRLMNGEIFHLFHLPDDYLIGHVLGQTDDIKYDASAKGSPFRFGDHELSGAWEEFDEFKIEYKWYHEIPKEGVLCKCHEIETNGQIIASEYRIIVKCNYDNVNAFNLNAFIDNYDNVWQEAIPLNKHEILKFAMKMAINGVEIE